MPFNARSLPASFELLRSIRVVMFSPKSLRSLFWLFPWSPSAIYTWDTDVKHFNSVAIPNHFSDKVWVLITSLFLFFDEQFKHGHPNHISRRIPLRLHAFSRKCQKILLWCLQLNWLLPFHDRPAHQIPQSLPCHYLRPGHTQLMVSRQDEYMSIYLSQFSELP